MITSRVIRPACGALLGVCVFACSAEAQLLCDITLSASAPKRIAALNLSIDYRLAGGQFVGRGQEVACADLTNADLTSVQDNDKEKILRAGWVKSTGLLVPLSLMKCRFEAEVDAPRKSDFLLSVYDAADVQMQPLAVTASVEKIACKPAPGTCGDVNGDGKVAASDALLALNRSITSYVALSCADPCMGPNGYITGEAGGDGFLCHVILATTAERKIAALNIAVDYTKSGGGFLGSAQGVQCMDLSSAEIAAFYDYDDEKVLRGGWVKSSGLATSVDVASCHFYGDEHVPLKSDFGLDVYAAADVNSMPLAVLAFVRKINCMQPEAWCVDMNGDGSITAVDALGILNRAVGFDVPFGCEPICPIGAPTTTTTSTSSTTTTPVSNIYNVAFDLTDAVTVMALQFEVDYGAAGGEFLGTGTHVNCTSPLSARGAFVSFQDLDASARLRFAALATAGYTGPTRVANCDFVAPWPPATAQFAITVVDASAPDLTPIVPLPSVAVTEVVPK